MEAVLDAVKRETRGKNEARRLRASGRIPAVVYGAEKNRAVEIAVDLLQLPDRAHRAQSLAAVAAVMTLSAVPSLSPDSSSWISCR